VRWRWLQQVAAVAVALLACHSQDDEKETGNLPKKKIIKIYFNLEVSSINWPSNLSGKKE
jgi:hypothetical protein